MNNRRMFTAWLLTALFAAAWAQGPNSSGVYYKNADGKKGKALKTALCGIIYSHTQRSYDNLWDDFKTTDVRADGKVWDMYSGTSNFTFGTDQAGNYSKEGDVYNREHSFPKSWFNEATPMYTDLFHLYPTDGYVNGRRGNLPFGEVSGTPTYESNNSFSKVGKNGTSGYSGTVFEPNDEYKGDFARTYFYMVTCYENQVEGWSCEMLSGDTYPALSDWALALLLKWATNDPVSQKEIDRNNAVYKIQKNRNPFIDYPGLEQYIWGSKTDTAFSYDNYDGSGMGGGGDDSGGETENIVWSEDWQTASAGNLVTAVTNAAATYSAGDTQYTKIYDENNAGGTAPELLLPNSSRNSYFMATITLGGASGDLTLTFNSNRANVAVTTTTNGVTIGSGSYADKVYTFTISVPEGTETLALKFATTSNNNTRVDNFLLTEPADEKGGDEQIDVTLAFSPSSATAQMGTAFTPPTLTITPTNADIDVTYSSNNTSVATVDASTGAVTLVAAGTAVITAAFAGNDIYKEAEASYTLTVTKAESGTVTGPGIYRKITSTDQLEAGKNYLLVYEATPVAYAGFDTNKGTAGSVTIEDNTIDMNDESNNAAVLVIEAAASGNWLIKDGDVYLALTSAKNTLSTQTSATATGTEWTISFDNGSAKINSAYQTKYYLQYNDDSKTGMLFRCYAGTQKYPALYKEVETVEVSVSSVGYATLYYGTKHLIVPDGVEAITYKLENDELAESTVYEAGATVPAATGVVLRAAAGTYSFEVSADGGSVDDDNLLQGSDEAALTTGGGKYYMLSLNAQNDPASVGFYYGKAGGAAFTNGAHKAYLAVPDGAAAKSSYLFADQTTGVGIAANAPAADAHAQVYALDGRRMDGRQLPKGIYVRGGKKFVVK